MSDLQFEENNVSAFQSRIILGKAVTPKMITFLINRGIVKDQKTAGKFLLGICIIFILASILILAVFVFDVNLTKKDTRNGPGIGPLKERI